MMNGLEYLNIERQNNNSKKINLFFAAHQIEIEVYFRP